MPDFTIKISTPADLTGAQATQAAFQALGAAVEKVAAEEQTAGRSADELKGKFDQMRDAGGRFTAVGEGAAGASKSMKALAGETDGFLAKLELGFGVNFAGKIIEGVESIGHAFVEVVEKGIEFNAQMERSGIALAGALRASDPDRFLNFEQARSVGAQALDQLRDKANALGLDLHGLTESFSINLTSMTEGGVRNLQDQINLTVLLGQVAQAKGISGFQATRDTTDLLNGQASRTMLGRELGIKDEDIKKAKEAGTIMEFLTEKLKAYGEAGEHASDTFSASVQTIKNELEQLAGTVTKPTFEKISEFLREIKKPLGGETATGTAAGIGDTLGAIGDAAQKAGPHVKEVHDYLSRLNQLVTSLNWARGLFSPIFESDALKAQYDAQQKIVLSLQDQITHAKTQEQVTAARQALEEALAGAVKRTTEATGEGKVAAQSYLTLLQHLQEVFPIGKAKDVPISPEAQAKKDAAGEKEITGTTDFALLKARASGNEAEVENLLRRQAIETQIDTLKKARPELSAKELEKLAEQNVALKEQADAVKTISHELSQIDHRQHKADTLEGVTAQIQEKSKGLSSALPDDLRGSLSVSQMAGAIESLPANTAAEATEKAKLLKIVGELVELEERRAKLSEKQAKDNQETAKDQVEKAQRAAATLADVNEQTTINEARARGENAVADALERQRDVRREIKRLQDAGVSSADAQYTAERSIAAQIAAKDRTDADRATRKSGGGDGPIPTMGFRDGDPTDSTRLHTETLDGHAYSRDRFANTPDKVGDALANPTANGFGDPSLDFSDPTFWSDMVGVANADDSSTAAKGVGLAVPQAAPAQPQSSAPQGGGGGGDGGLASAAKSAASAGQDAASSMGNATQSMQEAAEGMQGVASAFNAIKSQVGQLSAQVQIIQGVVDVLNAGG